MYLLWISATRPAVLVSSYITVSLSMIGRSGDRALGRHLVGTRDHVVDEAVVARLVCGEPAVPVGGALDLVDRLAGVERDPLLHDLLRVEHLLGLDRDVTR